MKKDTVLFFIIFLLAIGPGFSFRAHASETKNKDEVFLESVKAYEKGDYLSAVKGFEKLALNFGVSNHELYYNAGNAYLKLGQYGMAKLWYKRAERLAPGDSDLKFNLRYLENRLKDDFEIKRGLSNDVFFMSALFSESTIIISALLLNAVFWTILLALITRKSSYLKNAAVITGLIAFVFLSNAFYVLYERTSNHEAIIVSDEVSVRSGASDKAPELFRLHSGTSVVVEGRKEKYLMISNGDDKRGWIGSGEAAVVSVLE